VRTWHGDFVDLPVYMGSADAIFLNAMFGNVHDQVGGRRGGVARGGRVAGARSAPPLWRAPPRRPLPGAGPAPGGCPLTRRSHLAALGALNPCPPQHYSLARAAQLLKPGGYAVISHAEGRAWHAALRGSSGPGVIPHELPDRAALERLLFDSPFEIVELRDDPQLYLALLRVGAQAEPAAPVAGIYGEWLLAGATRALPDPSPSTPRSPDPPSSPQIPPGFVLPTPVALAGTVVAGFGRGSRDLAVPTANIDPAPLQDKLATLPRGVYFGWAQLDPPAGSPAEDGAVHKMVMNIGARPTVNTGALSAGAGARGAEGPGRCPCNSTPQSVCGRPSCLLAGACRRPPPRRGTDCAASPLAPRPRRQRGAHRGGARAARLCG
jgi:hypothetical protein